MTNDPDTGLRVNARFDGDDAAKLDFLVRTEGKSVTDIVRTAIRRYYEAARAERSAKTGQLEASGFIGCAEADPDLSTTYKRQLRRTLATKHGDR